MEYIRYKKDDGTFAFPTVKDVGDINTLLTNAKNSLVESVNEIFNKIGVSPSDVSLSEIIANVQAEIERQQNELMNKINSQEYNQYVSDTRLTLNGILEQARTFEQNFIEMTNKFVHTDEELSNKIGRVEYDKDFGVNKW